MRCPFGCRQAHRKESSNKRSAEYYRSKEGKDKKKALNERRSRKTISDKDGKYLAAKESTSQQGQIVQNDPVVFGKTVNISYIQMLISLIAGRLMCLDEVLGMLRKIVRQHSMDRKRRFLYAFSYPEQKPP